MFHIKALGHSSLAAIATATSVCLLAVSGVASASAAELVLTTEGGTNVNEQAVSWESSNLTVTTSGPAAIARARAHSSRSTARAAGVSNIYLLTHPWVIIDWPGWESIVGPAQNVFDTPFATGLTSPAGGASFESYDSSGHTVPWLGTINVSGQGTLKAITPNMRFVLAVPGGPSCVFAAKQMKLKYPVGTPGNPVALKPAFKQSFSLDTAHSQGGACPAKATLAGFFDVFTENQAAPQQVYIQS